MNWIGTTLVSISALGGALALVWHGKDVATVGAILAAVGLFLDNRFRMRETQSTLKDQNDTLSTIADNVNGKLDARMRRIVDEALAATRDDNSPEDPEWGQPYTPKG